MFLVYIPWVVQGPPSSNGTFKRHPAGDQPLLYNKLDGTNSKTTIPQWYHVLLMASIGNKQELEIGLLHKQTCHTLGRQKAEAENKATAQSLKEGTISSGTQRNSAQTRSRSVPANLSRIMSARIRCWFSEKNSLKQPTVPLTTSSSR